MANEAYVKISEVLVDAPVAASADAAFLVAGAIKARYGDFEISYFESRQDFLDKYTVDGVLSGKEDISLINAYEVLGSSPILVARAASKDYTPYKINIEDDSNQAYFSVVFNDYMRYKIYKVKYSIKPYEPVPGALLMNISYLRSLSQVKFDVSNSEITTPGTGYSLGDVITLSDKSNGGNVIKARVYDVGESGDIKTIKLLTSVTNEPDSSSDIVFNVTGGSGEGAVITFSGYTELQDEVIKSYEIIFSLDENSYDSEGSSLFYQNVWRDEYPFTIELGSAIPESVDVPNPLVESDPTQPEILTYLRYYQNDWDGVEGTIYGTISGYSDNASEEIYDDVAVNASRWGAKFETFEDRQITIFTDFGVSGVGSTLKGLAEQFYGMYLISLPRSNESVAGAQTWDELDLGNSRRYACTPFAQTTHLGFTALIAPTTQYINTVCTNIASGNEFEAVAGTRTGIANYSNLTKKYDKSERESLLDLKINTITYRDVDGFAIFNDDLTGLVQNNPFKEEFNRRLGIEIAQSVELLMRQFLFKLNTPALRDNITSVIENYLETSSFRDKFDSYKVQCDDNNNPAWLQAQNKVAVSVSISFYYPAKYIEVTNKIYSTGQTFDE